MFRASGAKTGKSFEEKSTYVSVKTRNLAIVIEGTRRRPRSDIYVGSLVTRDPAKLGGAVKNLLQLSDFWTHKMRCEQTMDKSSSAAGMAIQTKCQINMVKRPHQKLKLFYFSSFFQLTVAAIFI